MSNSKLFKDYKPKTIKYNEVIVENGVYKKNIKTENLD